ncbi:TPA: hypothetical protein ACH3X2_004994 [Trebouxia sp. C0005]
MARFASEAELETFLGRLDPDYGQYASAVWQNGVRTPHKLANADKEDLVAAGVTSAIHAKDMKARAGPQGEACDLKHILQQLMDAMQDMTLVHVVLRGQLRPASSSASTTRLEEYPAWGS